MFKKNDYVVYPLHGIGKLESIEKKGEESIFKIRLKESQMLISLPYKSVKQIGIRKVVAKDDVKKIITDLSKKPEDLEDNWRLRFQKNIIKLKKGDVDSMISLIKELYLRSRKKPLSMIEKRQFESSYNLLVKEISLVTSYDEKETNSLVASELEKLL